MLDHPASAIVVCSRCLFCFSVAGLLAAVGGGHVLREGQLEYPRRMQMLRAELEGQRKRAADLEEMVAAVRSGSCQPAPRTRRTRMGTMSRPRARGWQPHQAIAGVIRKAPPPLNHRIMVHAANGLDKIVALLTSGLVPDGPVAVYCLCAFSCRSILSEGLISD